jgi:acyl carrier protein
MNATRDEILANVARIVREVIDEQWVSDLVISVETRFSQDLELESIEFVALAEKLRAEYDTRVDLAGWLSGMSLDEILALRVGQLVDYIEQCNSQPPAA